MYSLFIVFLNIRNDLFSVKLSSAEKLKAKALILEERGKWDKNALFIQEANKNALESNALILPKQRKAFTESYFRHAKDAFMNAYESDIDHQCDHEKIDELLLKVYQAIEAKVEFNTLFMRNKFQSSKLLAKKANQIKRNKFLKKFVE